MATRSKVVLWPLFSEGWLITLDGTGSGWGVDHDDNLCPDGDGWGNGSYACDDLSDVAGGNGVGFGRVNRASYNGQGYGYGEGDQEGGGSFVL